MQSGSRRRLRDHGLSIGVMPIGPLNAITDVPGVRVGHATVIADRPHVARTGVTLVYPGAGGMALERHVFGAVHSFNGFGEVTGVHWMNEGGLLSSPICLTSTFAIGLMRDTLIQGRFEGPAHVGLQPLVAETNDGRLNDGRHSALTVDHLRTAMADARTGPVAEGNVGGGTGMICHGWKGGIGTASRRVATQSGTWMLGVLVQANHGRPEDLVVAGHPVGRELSPPPGPPPPPGSIIGIVATDAPLLPHQCARLARRAPLGMGRVGGTGANGSGEFFLAVSTANSVDPGTTAVATGLRMVPNAALDPLFAAVAEATEEAILNALFMAQTMQGRDGAVVLELDAEQVSKSVFYGE